MKKNSILLYKNRPCVLKDFEKDKIVIELEGDVKKVREKDTLLLVEDAASSITEVLNAPLPACNFEEGIDLLEGEEHSFSSLVSLFWSSLPKVAYYKAWQAFSSSSFFVVNPNDSLIYVNTKEEIEALERKEKEKKAISDEADSFLEVLKELSKKKESIEVDKDRFAPFFQDLEDIALGKKEKLKLIKDKKISKEEAHNLLLKAKIWSIFKNPYPYRYKKIIGGSKKILERKIKDCVDLTYMASYAIDNEGTNDPDDAISYDGKNLYIHIALVADSVEMKSEYEAMLQERGRSLYLPDGTHYMMGDEDTKTFSLGLTNPSYALSFCITLKEDATIENVEIMRSKIKVERLTYSEASKLKDKEHLKCFFDIAKKNYENRLKEGAISIEIPEVNISLKEGEVIIEEHIENEAFAMIREMMLLTGEATAFFAFKNNIPFQYISQAAPTNMPKELLSGLAGEFQKRRYIKGRSVGTSPSAHSGLGLSMYSQITSPMRRYGDLISQKQLLNFIDGKPYIPTEELFAKIAIGDISYRDSQLAERLSKKHFTLIYLLQNPDIIFDATVVAIQDSKIQVYIKSLGLEEYIHSKKCLKSNDEVKLKVLDVNLAMLNVTFKEVDLP